MKWLFLVVGGLLSGVSPISQAQPLPDLLRAALAFDPAVAGARAQVRAAEQREEHPSRRDEATARIDRGDLIQLAPRQFVATGAHGIARAAIQRVDADARGGLGSG